MSRRRRALTDEERQLWENVARSTEPLRPRRPKAPTQSTAADPGPLVADNKPAAPQALPRLVAKPAARIMPAPKVGIDRRTRTQLARGSLEVDARLDLHGLTQSLAHQRLRRFLDEAQASGARLVLIITGKGKPADEVVDGDERGVLKRAVPGWLRGAEFRHLVVSFEEAGRRHGGGGALYVRVRRKR